MKNLCKKIKYKSPKSASRAIDRLVELGEVNPGDMNIYPCGHCRRGKQRIWHIGHKRYAEKISPNVWEKLHD